MIGRLPHRLAAMWYEDLFRLFLLDDFEDAFGCWPDILAQRAIPVIQEVCLINAEDMCRIYRFASANFPQLLGRHQVTM
jgi:hypothetical protein